MFTGIITDTTTIVGQEQTKDGLELTFKRPKTWNDLQLGESIATNGVCLTITRFDEDTHTCLLIPETLRVSTFGKKVPKKVNLERSLRVGDRLSGHIVQGHVDCTAEVDLVETAEGYDVWISLDKKYMKYLACKGSVTVNGVALTIAGVKANAFSVALVPHTLEHTALGDLVAGDEVNLEFDAIAKYVEQLLKEQP